MVKVRIQHPFSDDELIEFAKTKHPECEFGIVVPGLSMFLQHAFSVSRVVQLWRNVDCYIAEDPVRATVEGFPPFIIEIDETDYEKAKTRLTHEDEVVRRNAQRVVERYEKAVNMKSESG